MKILFAIFSITFIISPQIFAQNNYKPGYVINLNGDTIKGYINYRDWNKNPKQIEFKRDLITRSAEIYSANNITEFVVKDYEDYKRFIGKISLNDIGTNNLPQIIDSTYRVDTVFLRVLTSGKNVTLYQYTDKIKERYFIAQDKAQPVELIYRLYLSDGQLTFIQKQNIYISQLQRLAAVYQPNDQKLSEEIQGVDYFSGSIKKIVLKINGQLSDDQFSKGDKRPDSRLYIGAGVNSTSLQFKSNNEFSAAGPSSSIFPQIVLGLDIFFNKNVGNTIFRTELEITGDKPSYIIPSIYNTSFNTTGTDHLSFNQYTVSLYPQILYNFYNTDNFKIYASAGITINYSAYTNIQLYGVSSSGRYTLLPVALEPPFFFTLKASAGMVINSKFDIHLAYVLPSSIDFNPQYYIRYTSYQFGVNYFLGKR